MDGCYFRGSRNLSKTEIAEEQFLVDRAYERLEAMTEHAHRFAAQAMANRASAGPLRDAIVENTLRRAAHLSIGDEPLVFGRIDKRGGQDEAPESHHIGRVAVYDVEHEPLVTDWRAPAAEPFYKATPREPLDVIRRRHILCRGRQVIHLEDELLDATKETDGDLVLVGEAALMYALNRERSGRMRDIVSTIQREQDEIIRAPLEGVLVVQGGPGTGKTAVALHRAAYLLYTHRERLSRTGVLIVGPSPVFLRYIAQVLPSLGESATLGSVGELVAGVTVTAHDPSETSRVKGDPRMAKVMKRAVSKLPRALDAPVRIRFESTELILSVAASRRIVKLSKEKMRGTHNVKRSDVRDFTIAYLYNRWLASNKEWARMLRTDEHHDDFERELRQDETLMAALDHMWPVRTGAELVAELKNDPSLFAAAADGILSPAEQQAFEAGPRDGFTEADVALIDEANPMLGPWQRRVRRRPKLAPEERFHIERLVDDLQELDPIIRSERKAFVDRLVEQRLELEQDGEEYKRPPREWFGHVVVDEAQSLSPMQWRMIARRGPAKSMTIVGDLGQSVGPWASKSWEPVVEELSPPNSRVAELSINYRSPGPVAELAAKVLAAATPELKPPRAVRTDGDPLEFIATGPGEVAQCAAEIAQREAERTEGTVAVISTPDRVEALRTALGIHLDADVGSLLDENVAVFDVDDARGLEFDSVLLVEPAAIVSHAGLSSLYVSLTRPTQHLIVVHSLPLPASLNAT